jgi:hypothetical protein
MSSLKPKKRVKHLKLNAGLAAKGACLGVLASAGLAAQAQTDTNTMTSLEQQNEALQSRIQTLEDLAKREGLLPSGNAPYTNLVTAMSKITITGFVQGSYFYDTRRPVTGTIDDHLWNTKDNSFSLNKFKLTIAGAPVATDKWDATFRASLLFGQDATYLNTPDKVFGNTSFNDLREAYVELNVPIGTGLDIKAGELISLLNWESGDGGAANPNFSQGLQWWFTGNGPSAGIQATYNFTDKVNLTMRVDNGLFQGPVDDNAGKDFSGSLNFKPTANLWFNLVGWYESADAAPDATISGGEIIGGYQATTALGTGWEVDYFHFDNDPGINDTWSVGGWIWYDFTDKIDVALRADYVSQAEGNLLLGGAITTGLPVSTDNGGGLGSITLTLNYKPTPALKIQPEIQYDYTTYNGGLEPSGHKDRILVGCGVTYLF